MQYALNFVRSAIPPDTIVADVAQKTVWKIANAHSGTPRRQNVIVLSTNQWVKGSYDGRTASKHQPKPCQPEGRCADAEIHQVLHQNISCILCPGKSGFTHGESRLHEEH